MYCAFITTLKELRKHSNADRLMCTEVFGNNVIVDLSYYEGQRIIFFPTDGQISLEFAIANNLIRIKNEDGTASGGYLNPSKRSITALKLRGEKSEGLALPIECLKPYVDIETLKDGDQITLLNGIEICKKYIPCSEGSAKETVQSVEKNSLKLMYPFFKEHIDTSQLAYNLHAFKPGDIVYITLKMHGTSARTANAIKVSKQKRNFILKQLFRLKEKEIKEFAAVSGSRRCILKDFDGGFYGDNAFRKKYHDILAERLPKGIEIFYEIVGYQSGEKPIMEKCSNKLAKDKEFSKIYGEETVFSYNCQPGENDIYAYRMNITNEDGVVVEIPWEQTIIFCEKFGIKTVPTFDKFIFTTKEDLMERVEKFYDGVDPVGATHIREGVVVRIDNREKFTAFKHKNFYFKMLEGIIKDNASQPDIEEAEEMMTIAE